MIIPAHSKALLAGLEGSADKVKSSAEPILGVFLAVAGVFVA